MAALGNFRDASWSLDRPQLILDGVRRAKSTCCGADQHSSFDNSSVESLSSAAAFTTASFRLQNVYETSATNTVPLRTPGVEGVDSVPCAPTPPTASQPAWDAPVPALFLGDVFLPCYRAPLPLGEGSGQSSLPSPYSLALAVQGVPSVCVRQERAEAICKELEEGLKQSAAEMVKEEAETRGLFGVFPPFPWQKPKGEVAVAEGLQNEDAASSSTTSHQATPQVESYPADQAPSSVDPAQPSSPSQSVTAVRRMPLLTALRLLQPMPLGGGPRRWPLFQLLTETADAEAVENAANSASFVVDLHGVTPTDMPIEVWEGEEEHKLHQEEEEHGIASVVEDEIEMEAVSELGTPNLMSFPDAKQAVLSSLAPSLPVESSKRLAVFRVPGFSLLLRTNAGLVSFQPAFLSCYHLHKAVNSAIHVYKKGWLLQRKAAREQWRAGVETTAVKLAGNAWLVSQINAATKESSASDAESEAEDEGWGMPAEAAELMEELGEKQGGGVKLVAPSNDDFASHVSAIAVGSISVATKAAVWTLDALDSAAAATPFGNWVMGIPNYVSVQADYLDDHIAALKTFNQQRLHFPPPTEACSNSAAPSGSQTNTCSPQINAPPSQVNAGSQNNSSGTSGPQMSYGRRAELQDGAGRAQHSMAYARKKVAEIMAHQLGIEDFVVEDDEGGDSFSGIGKGGGEDNNIQRGVSDRDENNQQQIAAAAQAGALPRSLCCPARNVSAGQCVDQVNCRPAENKYSGLQDSLYVLEDRLSLGHASCESPRLAELALLSHTRAPGLGLPMIMGQDNTTDSTVAYKMALSASRAPCSQPVNSVPAHYYEQVRTRAIQVMHDAMARLSAGHDSATSCSPHEHYQLLPTSSPPPYLHALSQEFSPCSNLQAPSSSGFQPPQARSLRAHSIMLDSPVLTSSSSDLASISSHDASLLQSSPLTPHVPSFTIHNPSFHSSLYSNLLPLPSLSSVTSSTFSSSSNPNADPISSSPTPLSHPFFATSPLPVPLSDTFPPLLPTCPEFSPQASTNSADSDQAHSHFALCAMPAVLSNGPTPPTSRRARKSSANPTSQTVSQTSGQTAAHFSGQPLGQTSRQPSISACGAHPSISSGQQMTDAHGQWSTDALGQRSTDALGQHVSQTPSQTSGPPSNEESIQGRNWWHFWHYFKPQNSLIDPNPPPCTNHAVDSSATQASAVGSVSSLSPAAHDSANNRTDRKQGECLHAASSLSSQPASSNLGMESTESKPQELESKGAKEERNADGPFGMNPFFGGLFDGHGLNPVELFWQQGSRVLNKGEDSQASKHDTSAASDSHQSGACVGDSQLGAQHSTARTADPSTALTADPSTTRSSDPNSSVSGNASRWDHVDKAADVTDKSATNTASINMNNSNSNNMDRSNNSSHNMNDFGGSGDNPENHSNNTNSSSDSNNSSSSSNSNNNSSSSSNQPNGDQDYNQVSAQRGRQSGRRRAPAVPRLQLECLEGVKGVMRVLWTVCWDMENGGGKLMERILKANAARYSRSDFGSYLGSVQSPLDNRMEVHMRIGITGLGIPIPPLIPMADPNIPHAHPPSDPTLPPDIHRILPSTQIFLQSPSQTTAVPHELDMGVMLDTKKLFAKMDDGEVLVDEVEWAGRIAECGLTPARGLLLIGDLGLDQESEFGAVKVPEVLFADLNDLKIGGIKMVCLESD